MLDFEQGGALMKRTETCRRGFTLIELMVVIVIILLLSGLLFKIAGLVGDKAARGRAIADIQKIENALNEYYSEYGIYPPVSKNAYVYEFVGGQPNTFQKFLKDKNNPDKQPFFGDIPRTPRESGDKYAIPSKKDWYLGYDYGLVSHLYFRDRGSQGNCWYDADTSRDKAAKSKWQHFLEGLDLHVRGKAMDPPSGMESIENYTNLGASIRDPWGHDYQYECKPPFVKYRLWSVGPDGNSGSGDDINNNAYSE
jgi:prepilin-type N-terminal cleavage/methylation domain-containing protein